jgi:dienelactone hydrolase
MRLQTGILILIAAAIGAPTLSAETQTLMRGECHTAAEAADILKRAAKEYDTKEKWQDHVEQLRAGVLRGMKLEHVSEACPLKPIRHSVRQEKGYTVENVAFESLPGFWVTGNLYLPDDGQDASVKRPGVLCPHGHLADNRMLEQTQKRCAALARMGAIAFAYDMIGYGESTQLAHHHSEAARLQTHNSRRVIDFMLSLGNVDESRLAVTGESGGGTQSFLLACVDPRIDVSVPVVMVSASFYGGCICESGMPIHRSAQHETNNVEIAGSIAPKPLLVISDGDDWTKNVPNAEFPFLQHVYKLMGAPDNVENAHFANEKHDYGPSKREAMYRFLAKHLQLDLPKICDAAGKIDESFAKVHDRAELLVFTPEHARPDYALLDGDQIIGQLDH